MLPQVDCFVLFCVLVASGYASYVPSWDDGLNTIKKDKTVITAPQNLTADGIDAILMVPKGPISGMIPWKPFPPEQVEFYLFTKNTLFTGSKWTGEGSIPSINSSLPTKILIHGWLESHNRAWYGKMKSNFLVKGHYNVIQVDWSKRSQVINYYAAARDTEQVGAVVGRQIISLGLDLDHVHIIGHSLGAQAAGFAGKYIKEVTGRLVRRITGLDPARPLFERYDEEQKLNSGDAKIVDVIHTDGGLLGYLRPFGTVDFFPNGGVRSQPGCGLLETYKTIDIIFSCSHSRSVDFFAESILSDYFVSTQCKSYDDYKSQSCVANKKAIMGNGLHPDAQGVYYLSTDDREPFALG